MQFFRDTANGEIYSFDDDVVTQTDGSVLSFLTEDGRPVNVPTTLQPCAEPVPPTVDPAPVYIPNWLVRQRLQTANLWDQAVTAMTPAQQLEFATLQDGILPDDSSVIALLTAIGAKPSEILALPA